MASDERTASPTLRIAFDLDGVLANMEAELIRQAEHVFGRAITASAPAAADEGAAESLDGSAVDAPEMTSPALTLRLTSRQQRRLWKHVESIEDFWETLSEIEPGAIARLAALAAERRWEVIFLTKRPQGAGRTAQVQTQRWLVSKGFPLPSVFVVQGSRGRIAASLDLDIVVDDRHENCLDVIVDSKARAILVWRDDEKKLPIAARRLGIGVVTSVNQCLDALTQLDAEGRREQPGMFDRVLRMLGFKESANV
jgi:hypothetical protein